MRGSRRRKTLNSYRKRRHDKQGCLLCILRDDTVTEQTVRKRKTSTNSAQRIRTGDLFYLLNNLSSAI